MERTKLRYKEVGNLSSGEIEEIIGYDFIAGPDTVRKQVRRYYLQIKSRRPEKAAQLLSEVEPLLKKGVQTEQEVHDLSIVLDRYMHGFVIFPELTQEMKNERAQNFTRPLTTLTSKADKPFQVWHHGRSITALYKAWRQGRPTIIGYGMTEQEAIDELRYVIQPDFDGTLDGLGKPSGTIIGGNMFSKDEVLKNNKGRFS